ncbi:phosphotransferase [Microbacterium sp.]|uniref:phosphotransferase n=1 Tax=Microbacterium sp. TaxID=51671 RepID=UPI00333ECD7E
MEAPTQVTILADRVVKRGRSPEAAANEAAHYRAMEVAPPPFPTPRLISWNGDELIVTRLGGRALGGRKILEGDVSPRAARACVALATSTAEWDPPVDRRRFDDVRQVEWGLAEGVLQEGEVERMRRHAATATRVFQHGDLIPPNVFVDGDRAAVIDFEWSGRGFVNGLDWARLLANGWGSDALRAELLSAPIAATADGAFSWAVVLCHELRQVERDGAGADWAADARRLYLGQLPALRAALSALPVR